MVKNPQSFFDEATIVVIAGRGGDGMSHFRREKYVPRGGPDGGDGGRGGNVILRAQPNVAAFTAFQYQQAFHAEDGKPGEAAKRHGREGASVVVEVPCGTVVRDAESGGVLADLISPSDETAIVKGGRGGWGNVHFKSSRFQTPEIALRGEPGEERRLKLELELIADAGLVGAPNAGKSSLLAHVTSARPKIAPYPFTTLQPVLGVVTLNDRSFVLADLPGLIEGASHGAGLGFQFLRHVRRSRVLVHVVDGSGLECPPLDAYETIRAELSGYDTSLNDRPELVAFNKMDLGEARDNWPAFESVMRERRRPVIAISTATGQGLTELMGKVAETLDQALAPPRPTIEQPAILRPTPVDEMADITRRDDGAFVVHDTRLEALARRLNLTNTDAQFHFQRQLDRRGITRQLETLGATDGDTVVIGEVEMEWTERPR